MPQPNASRIGLFPFLPGTGSPGALPAHPTVNLQAGPLAGSTRGPAVGGTLGPVHQADLPSAFTATICGGVEGAIPDPHPPLHP
jgi:hypothetical protein